VSFTVTASNESANGGNTFIVSVKYSAKSIVGSPTPVSLGLPTTEVYNWTTAVNGTVQATAGVPLKLSGTQLAPSAGSGVGVASLTDQQLQPVVEAALARWEAAGLSDAQLSVLRNTSIHIADFLDAPRLGVESDGEIWLNATAAGWGWFTDASAATPAAGQMDLLTVVEHEFGHVLFGVQNGTGLMAATLDPGVRLLPSAAGLGLDQQLAAGPANPAVPAPSLTRAPDVEVAQTSFTTRLVGVSPPAVNTPAAVLVMAPLPATSNSVLIPTNSYEQRAAAQAPVVVSATTAVPGVVPVAPDRGSATVLIPGQRPTSPRGESSGDGALPLDEARDAAWAEGLVPGADLAGMPFDPNADAALGSESRQRACDACFDDDSWLAEQPDTLWAGPNLGRASEAAVTALVLLGGSWNAGRVDSQPRRRRWLN
jgi:hypothetical protein